MASDITCPICGSETTLRTAKKGPNAGRQFYVCIHYPECKGKVDLRIQNKMIALGKPVDQHEQDTQTARAEFERYKAEQEAIIQDWKAEIERYKALQEWMIKNDRVIQEQIIRIENRRAKDRLQQIDSRLKLKEEINKPEVIDHNEKCVVHQSRNAVAICNTCGNGVCDTCRIGLGDKIYSPPCFDKIINS